ncbi:chromosome segregation protein SMC [Pseudonocardia broussonetiae]|uniref:Chromosome partition protein Smc n=1 Tax=Pseudonocardia broussonetiae TaxID=2736640 RepID=A0A6M6JSI3_9PSEU|nr:chromosome segregation protein SMC [Pseudonocardia broussonetiae]QJY50193.1 chromosome segregation protein SMC [Pseudonocardia broussonetiae]
MHLKSLTLKGFKSFASATTLRLEPGITCVVGPNGSGKSNVVDAISWVLGEQGAKALRGGKMEDVIFAGTSGRAPLGRAEVTLTIDNSDGALPIEYSEVSITRRMFRDGAGEYEINGSSCRLLDIQELLSDSGIGREMHVIVGQGQLDSVLQSKPEDRRAYIEEAAGVLKHRKRKEKALRKLDAMQANLTRLTDLTAELRRQLKPLGRQAEIARRAQSVQADLRDSRLRLAADDLVTLRDSLAREEADESAARARRAEVEEQLSVARVEQERLETALAADAPLLAAAQDTWYRLSALAERLAGTVRLAQERGRHLAGSAEERTPGRDPDQLEAEAEAVAEQEDELVGAVTEARAALAEILETRAEHERTLAAAERAHRAAVRALADRRAGLATLAGRAEAMRSTAAATADEIERLSDALAEAEDRTASARSELEEAGDAVDSGDVPAELEERRVAAVEGLDAARARVADLVAQEREAEKQRAHWRARVDALSVGLARKDGSASLLGEDGVLGAVPGLLTVEPWARTAVAAVLGELADAVAVADAGAAVGALRLLRARDAGRAVLVVGSAELQESHVHATSLQESGFPATARWVAEGVAPDGPVASAVRRLLSGVVAVDSLDDAAAVVAADPALTAVTAEGDVLGAARASGGSGTATSALDVQAAVTEAAQARDGVEEELTRLRPALEGARAEESARQAEVEAARRAQNAAEQRRSAASAQLGRMEQAVRSAAAEAQRLRERRDAVESRRSDALLALEAAEQQLAVAEDEPVDDEPDTEVRDAAADAVETARSSEVDARLALRTAEERARAISGRAESLRRQASSERMARERAAAAREARERGAAVAALVVEAGEVACARIAQSLAVAAAERDAAAAARDARERELGEVRLTAQRLTALMEKLTDAVHRDEVLRAQSRLRLEQVTEKVLADHGLGVEDLVAEYGPDAPVPASLAEVAEYEAARERGEDVTAPPAMPYDRATQERRAARAEKDLALLGRVNPLALEEFAALEERYRFLSTQLEDLKNTRRDLLTVVREVDDKILEVFAQAYEDVAREFTVVFETLFPGGEGRLVLTDPEDMLTTGVEVEARPPGKKVKRLSLLSGGERSLTAMALLVAIFRARPSPFYILDEIEAALDDVNLRRLISLMEELRATSQLIVITHQKPTMEVADALYGVAMRGDGITTVISQRLRPAS